MSIRFQVIEKDGIIILRDHGKYPLDWKGPFKNGGSGEISFDPDEDPGYRFAEKERRRRRIQEKERRGR